MKEDILRGMIRKQIKSSLTEADFTDKARSSVGTKLGSIEKMAGVKMLKTALGQGTPQQQAAGLLKVVQAISGGNTQTGKLLGRLLLKGGIATAEEPVDEVPVEDMTSEASSALSTRSAKVDKTQAMSMLKKAVATKPATQQAEFILDLIKGFGVKDGAKKRIYQNMRKALGEK